ncbi:MAG: phospholipid carrier-dependent glycosyltransferase [Promethearchaeota archaeon]
MDELAHYILIVALVEDKTFIVNKYVDVAYWVVGYYEGNHYIAKAPGLSFLGIPIYIASKFLGNYIPIFTEYQFILISFVAFLSSLTVVLVYDMCHLFECKERTAIITSLLYAFGTIAWTDSKMLDDASVSPFFILLGIYLLLRTLKANDMTRIRENMYIFLAGLSLGYSLLVEYTNAVIIFPCIIWYMFQSQGKSLRVKDSSFYIFIIPILLCLSSIFALDYFLYGSPFENPYRHKYTGSGVIGFNITNIPNSLFFLLFYAEGGGGGSLFLYQPLIFITSSFGLILMYKQFKEEALLFLISISSNILLFSLREPRTNINHHIGPAYMAAILPLILIFTAFTIEYFSSQDVTKIRKRIFWGIFISLFSFSIVILGICVLAFHIDVMAASIAYLKAFELLQSGYLDPRLLKHRFIPVFAGIFIFLVVFEAYIKKLYDSIVQATSERMSS